MNYHVHDRTPERELDARIATEVMGWQVRWASEEHPVFPGGDWENKLTDGPYTPPGWPVKRYSTDIAAAWLVVKKMTGADPDGLEYAFYVNYGPDEWECGFVHPNRYDWWVASNCETAQKAICLAALKAVGGDNA